MYQVKVRSDHEEHGGQVFALKIILDEDDEEEPDFERAEEEIRALEKLNHDHIVRYIACFKHEDLTVQSQLF